VGIEKNIFQEFSGCTNNSMDLIDKDELLKSLSHSRPNCKNINLKIFGLSLATINLIISSLISVLMLMMIKYEKNR
jgi:disulfide bond formation protein DsbB